ncbi:aldo/keto reductase [Leucobacter insecticola]|uniref:Aldo/keto reductase n=1 Tax=Leucobacter insecticola TaxID=2714934 RepID=A0A6G8FKD1_9MICO|nr:aldo/keto reductase [Leucobacter insecticola]QIM16827.1 aldo/keto reductase [Leucobacter insecticola]
MNKTIPTRFSGPAGIAVSELGFGSWDTWNRASFEEVVDNLRLAIAAGVTLFDVGIYGDDLENPKENSTDLVLARALRAIDVPRDAYQLAAKAWLPGGHREVPSIPEQTNALLRRHRSDHADILVLGDLMMHLDDFTPILSEVQEVIRAGKALGWAVNNWSAADIARATEAAGTIGLQAPEYAQLKYGLTRRSIPEGAPFSELCEAQGLTIQASDTFEGGLIFGSTSGSARMIGGDIGGIQAKIRASVGQLRDAAASLGATVAQLSIALPLTNPHTSSVLVGSRTAQQTRDNLGAFALLERHSAAEIRAVAEEFWFDRDAVSPDASWGTSMDDDPASYVVVEKPAA